MALRRLAQLTAVSNNMARTVSGVSTQQVHHAAPRTFYTSASVVPVNTAITSTTNLQSQPTGLWQRRLLHSTEDQSTQQRREAKVQFEPPPLTSPLTPAREKKLRELFKTYDQNQDGSIDVSELERAVSSMKGMAVDTPQLQQMIRLADVDGSGDISFLEFASLFEPVADEDLNLRGLAEYWMTSGELKDPTIIFEAVWKKLVAKHGAENMIFPREVICLGGAPGSGKGTNTPFIMKELGLTGQPMVMSSLLTGPHFEEIKARGGLVGDFDVLYILMDQLLKEQYRHGAVLDGFPRTTLQVEMLKMLKNKMNKLYDAAQGTERDGDFPRAAFRIVVLYVDEKESVRRQLYRGKVAMAHNRQVRETGEGTLMEIRDTDTSPAAAKVRYDTFRQQALEPLSSLKELFPYHVIPADGTLEEVQVNIVREMAYQSSLELRPATFEAIRVLPTAEDITNHGRQRLVERLDGYQENHTELFRKTVKLIKDSFIPVLQRHALAGAARVVIPASTHGGILKDPLVLNMIVDICADRHFKVIGAEPRGPDMRFIVQFSEAQLKHKTRQLESLEE